MTLPAEDASTSGTPPSLVERVEAIRTAVRDIYRRTLDEWLAGFGADAHPENEVAWWERFVECRKEYSSRHKLTAEQNKHVGKVMLILAMNANLPEDGSWLAPITAEDIADMKAIIEMRLK